MRVRKLTREKALDVAGRKLELARACVLVFSVSFLDGSASAEQMKEIAKEYREAAAEYESAKYMSMKVLRELDAAKPKKGKKA